MLPKPLVAHKIVGVENSYGGIDTKIHILSYRYVSSFVCAPIKGCTISSIFLGVKTRKKASAKTGKKANNGIGSVTDLLI